MGATSSKTEEDKALQLCRNRKKFVQQALDGRCSLAVTHIDYILGLKATGTALRNFVEPQALIDSSLHTSTTATPDPRALTEKSLSAFSFSSKSLLRRVEATENIFPSPSPTTSSVYQANEMKFRGSFSRKVEEKPFEPIIGSVTSSTVQNNTSQNNTHPTERPETLPFETSPMSPGTSPWDYFGLVHPVNDHFSSDGKEFNKGLDNIDDIRRLREDEEITDLEDDGKHSFAGREESQESEDDFDEPSTPMLVRSFENVTRGTDHDVTSSDPSTSPRAENAGTEIEFLKREKTNSPNLSPLRATSTGVALPNDETSTLIKEDEIESKVAPKDFFLSMKEMELLFIKASESGREVTRMLEANTFNFRPIFPGKARGSMASALLRTCFSCGEDPVQVQEEPPHTSIKYLTWHQTPSSRSLSSRNPLGANSRDEIEDFTSNIFDDFCMISGSHALTLDRLHAWEKKLYDEVKASERIRKDYDQKCKLLRQLESNDVGSEKIDKTRAAVKNLHSRLRVAIHRIDRISKNIEELRDRELQPQLEELINGLRRMWEVMLECHRIQVHVISIAHTNGDIKIWLQSDMHRQITIHLESELSFLASSFTKWIGAQEAYVGAINEWLFKCVSIPQKSSKRKRRVDPPPLRKYGPPIYATCDFWLEKLRNLPTKKVADSMKGLAAEIAHFIPRQEKNQGKGVNNTQTTSRQAGSNDDIGVNLLRHEVYDRVAGFDSFRVSLLSFLGQLNDYAESSVNMFIELQGEIEKAKINYEQVKSKS